jgi:hypothetical protein
MKHQIIRMHPQPGKSTSPTDYVHPTLEQLTRAAQARIRMRRAVVATLATDKP